MIFEVMVQEYIVQPPLRSKITARSSCSHSFKACFQEIAHQHPLFRLWICLHALSNIVQLTKPGVFEKLIVIYMVKDLSQVFKRKFRPVHLQKLAHFFAEEAAL